MAWKSGKILKVSASQSRRAARPGLDGPPGTWWTQSGEMSSLATARSPWLRTSSTMRRARDFRSSGAMVVLPGQLGMGPDLTIGAGDVGHQDELSPFPGRLAVRGWRAAIPEASARC